MVLNWIGSKSQSMTAVAPDPCSLSLGAGPSASRASRGGSRRILSRLACSCAAGAILALSGAAGAEEITFWSWRQEDKAAYQSFIEAFNQEHPDIEVRFEAFEAQNYATILSTALAAEQGDRKSTRLNSSH